MAIDLSLGTDTQNYFDTQDLLAIQNNNKYKAPEIPGLDTSGESFSNPLIDNTNRSVNSLEDVRKMAESYGYNLDNGSGFMSKIGEAGKEVWGGVVHALNFVPSTFAGITASVPSISKGELGQSWKTIRDYENNNKGFSDALKLYYKPVTIGDKAFNFTAGLAMDIATDPMTYLSFGFSGASKASKVLKLGELASDSAKLTKAAEVAGLETGAISKLVNLSKQVTEENRVWNPTTKLFELKPVNRELRITSQGSQLIGDVQRQGELLSIAKQLSNEGMPIEAAMKTAKTVAEQDIAKLIEDAYRSEGGNISQKTFDTLIEKGYSRNTLEDIAALGPKLLDRGGANWMGMRILDSGVLSKTPIGLAASKIYEGSGFEQLVATIKQPFKEMFSYSFGRNEKVDDLLRNMSSAEAKQIRTLATEMHDLLSPLSKEQVDLLGHVGLQTRMDTIAEINKTIEDRLVKIKSLNPDIGKYIEKSIDSSKGINNVKNTEFIYNHFESQINKIDSILKDTTTKLDNKVRDIASFKKFDTETSSNLADDLFNMRTYLSELKKNLIDPNAIIKTGTKIADLTPLELGDITKYLGGINEDLYREKILKTETSIGNLIKKINEGKLIEGTKQLKNKSQVISAEQFAKEIRDEIINISNEASSKIGILSKNRDDVLNALKDLSNSSVEIKSKFKALNNFDYGDSIVNEVAKKLWASDTGIISKMAKSVGIPEEQMFGTYLPYLFEQKMKVNGFANGSRNFVNNQGLGKAASDWKTLQNFKNAGGIVDTKKILAKNITNIVDVRTKQSFMRSAVNAVGKSEEYFQSKAQKIFGYISQENIEKLAKDYGYEKFMITNPYTKEQIGGYFPKEIIGEIKKGYDIKSIGSITPKSIVDTFDWVTNLNKAWVTGFFPGFHAKNWLSNKVNNLVSFGVRTLDPSLNDIARKMSMADMKNYRTLEESLPKGNKLISGWGAESVNWLKKKELVNVNGETTTAWKLFKQIRREYPELFQAGQFGLEELGISRGKLPDIIEKSPKIINTLLDPQSKTWQVTKDVGSHIESSAKLVDIVGMWMEGRSIKDGIKMAEKNLFNYNKLTSFEKQYMKRIIPFYTFSKKNIEFQMRMLAERPATTWLQYKMMNNLTTSFSNAHETDGKSGLPAYVQDAMGFHIGNTGSPDHKFISGFGLPIEEFMSHFTGQGNILSSVVSDVIGKSNKIITMPFEAVSGTDFFTGRRIEEMTNPDSFTSMIAGMPNIVGKQFAKLVDYNVIKKPIIVNGKYLGERDVVTADPTYLWLLRNSFLSRIVSSATSINRSIDATETPQGLFKYMTGVSVLTVDDKRNIFFNRMQEYKDLGHWLEKIGAINSYESFYLPQTQEGLNAKNAKKGILPI